MEYRQAHVAKIFRNVATQFFPEIRASFLSIRSRLEAFYMYKSTLMKNWWFLPNVTILILESFQILLASLKHRDI